MNPATLLATTTKFGAAFGISPARCEAAFPYVHGVRNAFRDAAYMMIDFPSIVNRATSSYGYYRKYLRQMRKHGKANPEDFKDADMNELRQMVTGYFHMRGPIMKIDMRIFNYMYVFMGIAVLWEAYRLQAGIDKKLEMGGMTWEDRKGMYDDDYEEDVRR